MVFSIGGTAENASDHSIDGAPAAAR